MASPASKLDRILKHRQDIVAQYAAGKISAAQLARRLQTNTDQYDKQIRDDAGRGDKKTKKS